MKYELTDLSKVPVHMKMDYKLRNENIRNKYILCERCEGTGNELYSMYKRCTKCNGTGVKKERRSKLYEIIT